MDSPGLNVCQNWPSPLLFFSQKSSMVDKNIYIVQGEISTVVGAIKRNSRWNTHTPLVSYTQRSQLLSFNWVKARFSKDIKTDKWQGRTEFQFSTYQTSRLIGQISSPIMSYWYAIQGSVFYSSKWVWCSDVSYVFKGHCSIENHRYGRKSTIVADLFLIFAAILLLTYFYYLLTCLAISGCWCKRDSMYSPGQCSS